jgi:hypothetical protein
VITAKDSTDKEAAMSKEESQEDSNGNHDRKRNGRKITKHHLIPRARGGRDILNNISKIPERSHDAWHKFFGNLTPKEAIQFIRTIFMGRGKRRGKWTVEDLYELQLEIQRKYKRR